MRKIKIHNQQKDQLLKRLWMSNLTHISKGVSLDIFIRIICLAFDFEMNDLAMQAYAYGVLKDFNPTNQDLENHKKEQNTNPDIITEIEKHQQICSSTDIFLEDKKDIKEKLSKYRRIMLHKELSYFLKDIKQNVAQLTKDQTARLLHALKASVEAKEFLKEQLDNEIDDELLDLFNNCKRVIQQIKLKLDYDAL
jgi:hypothetical protein